MARLCGVTLRPGVLIFFYVLWHHVFIIVLARDAYRRLGVLLRIVVHDLTGLQLKLMELVACRALKHQKGHGVLAPVRVLIERFIAILGREEILYGIAISRQIVETLVGQNVLAVQAPNPPELASGHLDVLERRV